MAGQLWASYQHYREKNEHLEPTEWFEDAETRELLKSSKRIGYQVKDTASPYGVFFDGIWQHEDGRTFELRQRIGGSLAARVWQSKDSFDRHKEVMPFGIWAWG
jgi:hypothetical protein